MVLVERFDRSLKNSLCSAAVNPSWHLHLPLVMLKLWSSSRDKEGISAAEQVFRTSLSLPGDFWIPSYFVQEDFLPRFQSLIAASEPPPALPKRISTSVVPDSLMSCKFVFIRVDGYKPPLSALYTGPYVVIRHYPNFFCLQIGTKTDIVSIGRLKPAFTLDPILPATPPRQGRLPNVIPAVNPPVISPPSTASPVISPPPVADLG